MPKLTLVVERTALKVYDIDRPVIRVGRETGLEVVIDNVAVSRHQAELRLQDVLWFVRDLDSGCRGRCHSAAETRWCSARTV
jgi:pSer/pThr/pTyr-binding forkhead associated (FHA) protein